MNKYKIKTQFVFEGHFIIKADSREQAEETVINHCGLVLGRDIHSSLSGEYVDWEFDMHPDMVIIPPKQNSKKRHQK